MHERLGHELTGDGTVHEAVATEAGDDVESRDAGDGADDARLIRRHLVEARVRTHELRLRERGRAVDRALDDARLETAVDLRAEAVGLVATAVTQQQARTFAPEREVLVRVDDERRGGGDPVRGKRRGHELVAPVGTHRDVDAGQRAHHARPRAGRDDDGARLERAVLRDDSA